LWRHRVLVPAVHRTCALEKHLQPASAGHTGVHDDTPQPRQRGEFCGHAEIRAAESEVCLLTSRSDALGTGLESAVVGDEADAAFAELAVDEPFARRVVPHQVAVRQRHCDLDGLATACRRTAHARSWGIGCGQSASRHGVDSGGGGHDT
jgi:hypothetical protein